MSAALDPNHSVVWRNLGIGYFNISNNVDKAMLAYDNAFEPRARRRAECSTSAISFGNASACSRKSA